MGATSWVSEIWGRIIIKTVGLGSECWVLSVVRDRDEKPRVIIHQFQMKCGAMSAKLVE